MNNAEKINLISIDIFKTKLTGIDNKRLIIEIRASDGEIEEHYLKDENHTYYEDKRYPFNKPEAEKLITALTSEVNKILGREMVLSDIWTLTLSEGQSVAAHSHKSNTYMQQEEFFSIAYYPSAPEGSADLIFIVDACNTLEKSILIKPETGGLVVFNSYLMHMTNRHKNKNEERIVVSANFRPISPSTTPTQDWNAYSRVQHVEPDYKSSKYSWTCSASVSTPFGEEMYTIGVLKNLLSVDVFNEKGLVSVNDFMLDDKHFECKFNTTTPIDADVSINLEIDKPNNSAYGVLSINEYPGYPIVGVIL